MIAIKLRRFLPDSKEESAGGADLGAGQAKKERYRRTELMASLTLRKAVEAALGHFKANADLLGAITNQDVTFEEAELSEDGAYWHITLGYPVKKRIQGFVEPLVYERKYTIFVIDGKAGTLQSLKMRPDVEPTPL